MTTSTLPTVFTALSMGLLVACGAAMSDGNASAAVPRPESPAAEGLSADAGVDADDVSDGATDGGCPYGSLEDGHRGFVRCLTADEVDGGTPDAGDASPPPPDAAPPSDAAPPPPPPAPVVKPGVVVEAPKQEGGEVPNLDKVLNKLADDFATCVVSAGGLTAKTGQIETQFLVRARGKAEGVEVLKVKGVSETVSPCIQGLLKNKRVGIPTADPVGVTFVINLRAG